MTPTPTLSVSQTAIMSEIGAFLTDNLSRISYVSGSAVVAPECDLTYPKPPAAAWYEPSTGDIKIHLDLAKVGVNSKWRKYENRLKGLLAHEASHSTFSGWLTNMHPLIGDMVTVEEYQVLVMFEELRIEQRAINRMPKVRPWLRAALPLVAGDAKKHPPTTEYEAAHMWALIYGRAITTSVLPSEVEWVDTAARTVLGDDRIDALTDILQSAVENKVDSGAFPVSLSSPRNPVHSLIEDARNWIELVGSATSTTISCSHTGAKSGSGGAGKGDDATEATDTELSDGSIGDGSIESDEAMGGEGAGGGMGTSDSVKSSGEIKSRDIDAEAGESIAGSVSSAIDETARHYDREFPVKIADPSKSAAIVFGNKGKSKTSKIKPKKPSDAARLHVTRTARALEQLAIPAVSKEKVPSKIPPGKIRFRDAVRKSADSSSGRISDASPWTTTRRRHTRVRPVVLGIATDTSGSMSWAEQAVADLAYIWTQAGQRIGARTAAVTYGDYVSAVCSPGEIMSGVIQHPAHGGKEEADKALAALDGVLHFSESDGSAKVLIMVSDGHFVISRESERVLRRLIDFKRAGTTVLWFTISDGYRMGGLVKELEKEGLITIVGIPPGESSKALDFFQEEALKVVTRLALN